MEVEATRLPATEGTDAGVAESSWTTRQVGGEGVYRSGGVGDVDNGQLRKVGYADHDGVYSLPREPPTGDGPSLPRAMGVFSTTAAGLYGFERGGTITLSVIGKKLLIRNGDNMLLEVMAPQ
jgi:hypothetical protein